MKLGTIIGLLDAPAHIQRGTLDRDGPYEVAIADASAEWLGWVGGALLSRAVVHRMTFARACVELALRTVPSILPTQLHPIVRVALETANTTAMSRGEAQRAALMVFEASHASYYALGHRDETSELAFDACAEACWVAGAELETSAGVAFTHCVRRCVEIIGAGATGKVLAQHLVDNMASGLRLFELFASGDV